ncbi:MAG: hypothetical protein RQ757_02280, partial [Pseudomonadales bacterium]|nr:hypothetical protein [Pseudomonadales bacterium]
MNKRIALSHQSDSSKLKPTAWYFLKAMAQFLFSPELRLGRADIPPTRHEISDDFCGVCVATSPDPDCDVYILQSLQELGLQHVRLDYGYDSPDLHGARLLETLLCQGYRVMLHLVQPLEEAAAMERPAARARWQDFVETALDRWGSRVELVEIGSTVNRRRWAGYTPAGFIACWQTAYTAASMRGLKISGPNISDFEPLYTIALLDILKSMGQSPEYYTDNLFVERVIQPEAYDHRV